MAAPPTNFPAIQTSDLFLSVTHPLSQDSVHTGMDAPPADNTSQGQDTQSIPPPPLPQSPRSAFAAFDPFPNLGSSNTPPPPAPDPPRQGRPASNHSRSDSGGRSRSQNRREGPGQSRSRSRSPSRDRSGSDGEDSEEDREHEYLWNPIVEDPSAPCDDELAYIETKEEHSALDEAYWRRKFFEERNNGDEAFSQSTHLGDGKIMLEIERFQGTKEQPNKDLIVRSPVVQIGGYDWQIKFYPKGNGADWLSLYVECTSMQNPGFEEYEEYDKPPFPFLKGQDYSSSTANTNFVKKRRTVAAQIGTVMYNPAEPRSNTSGLEAHRYSKACSDYGWPLFYQRYRLGERSHGERQPILRNDKLAFVVYIRVIDDPTSCLWGHDDAYNLFSESLLATGLRPFSKQEPHLAALVPVLHFEPFRNFIKAQSTLSKTLYQLQTILWKMYTRTATRPRERTRRQQEHDKRMTKTTDAVSCLKEISDALRKDCANEAAVNELLGTFSAEEGAFVGSSKLQGLWIQPEIRRDTQKLIATPALLTIELQRQTFDADERKWKKIDKSITVDQHLDVAGKKYTLFSFVTHCGDLQSNRHNVYVRPSCRDGQPWLAYTEGRVTAMTDKQALAACEGGTRTQRDSPFAGPQAPEKDEVIYAIIYVRDDCISGAMPREEAWDNVPESIREGREFERKANGSLAKPRLGSEPDMPLRDEQDRYIERDSWAGRAVTPDWPSMIVDADGDVVMSNSEDDTPLFDPNGARLDTKPSKSRKWYGMIDALGQDFYEGCMLGSQYHGEGHLVTMAGDEYRGFFYLGKMDGYGKMIYAQTGNIYEGQWERGKQHGQGKLTEAATGNIFEGGWEDGKKKGAFVLKGTVGGDEEDRSALCSVCYEKEMNTAFYDCGHVTCCKLCADKVTFCPVCRRSVVARLQIYGVKMTLE